MFGEKVDTLDNHVSISDFAGQLTFFSFQLFFLKKRDVVTITFNASVVLTVKIIVRERYDHAKKKREAAGMMTTIENIHFWMKSVSAHAGTDEVPKGCMSRRSPTAILCATHAEKLSAAQMEYVTKTVMDSLADKPYKNHLPSDPDKAIVFISNKKRKKFKSKIIKLKQIVLEAAAPAYSEERPISYLRLEQSIRSEVEKGSTIISVVEFTILVNRAGIPGDENSEAVAAALQYCTTRGTILHFPEVEVLAEKVFISPQWLSSIFAQIITTHKQESTDSSLYHAWKRYDTFAILEERFLDHILNQASVADLKEIIISLMQSFNLLAQIPTSTCFVGDPIPPPQEGRAFIVPALLLYDPQLAVHKPENQDQVYMYYFSDLYFPESVFSQILVKMISWNVQKNFQIFRIQYGFGQFSLGNSQIYSLLYEPNSFRVTIIVSQQHKNLHREKQKEAFKLFVELMVYLEESIISVMDLYIPSTKYPILHVCCPICGNPDPHIMVKHAAKISLDLPPLFCAKQGLPKELQPSSYLPFGDTLTVQEVGDVKEFKVFTTFFDKLVNILPVQDIVYKLISSNIITTDDDEEIKSITRSKDKASFVLRKVARSLEVGLTQSFYKLLMIMEERKGDAAILAIEIKSELQKVIESRRPVHEEQNIHGHLQTLSLHHEQEEYDLI
ncbi:uncharacterized protein [Dysidea avara]|uniref:uncharacterized protein isoform X2 n=1 Tax=Dysidea avara TaxID=196820 RepID=UPI003316EE94